MCVVPWEGLMEFLSVLQFNTILPFHSCFPKSIATQSAHFPACCIPWKEYSSYTATTFRWTLVHLCHMGKKSYRWAFNVVYTYIYSIWREELFWTMRKVYTTLAKRWMKVLVALNLTCLNMHVFLSQSQHLQWLTCLHGWKETKPSAQACTNTCRERSGFACGTEYDTDRISHVPREELLLMDIQKLGRRKHTARFTFYTPRKAA